VRDDHADSAEQLSETEELELAVAPRFGPVHLSQELHPPDNELDASCRDHREREQA
jgi:hypothetical protein